MRHDAISSFLDLEVFDTLDLTVKLDGSCTISRHIANAKISQLLASRFRSLKVLISRNTRSGYRCTRPEIIATNKFTPSISCFRSLGLLNQVTLAPFKDHSHDRHKDKDGEVVIETAMVGHGSAGDRLSKLVVL